MVVCNISIPQRGVSIDNFPIPVLSAACAANTAAPILPLLPAINNKCPLFPLWSNFLGGLKKLSAILGVR